MPRFIYQEKVFDETRKFEKNLSSINFICERLQVYIACLEPHTIKHWK